MKISAHKLREELNDILDKLNQDNSVAYISKYKDLIGMLVAKDTIHYEALEYIDTIIRFNPNSIDFFKDFFKDSKLNFENDNTEIGEYKSIIFVQLVTYALLFIDNLNLESDDLEDDISFDTEIKLTKIIVEGNIKKYLEHVNKSNMDNKNKERINKIVNKLFF